jgi:hypothetical protein
MPSFETLINSRKHWIENILRPWCREASLKDLKKAEDEWLDIAGKVATEPTLWSWCWERFPDLVHEGLTGVDESVQVKVRLKDGREATGYPDNRASQRGTLTILNATEGEQGPFPIDQIETIERVD